jgi:thiol:disulfide interchange protein
MAVKAFEKGKTNSKRVFGNELLKWTSFPNVCLNLTYHDLQFRGTLISTVNFALIFLLNNKQTTILLFAFGTGINKSTLPCVFPALTQKPVLLLGLG